MPPKLPLDQALKLAEELLSKFLIDLNSPTSIPVKADNPPPVLPLLKDSATLLKAQVTKLSLLAINRPFTASAISSVLYETSTTCLPAMMSAVQLAESETDSYAKFFAEEVRARVRRTMREMSSLVAEVKAISIEVEQGSKTSTKRKGRDSLGATGIVWSVCDEILTLATSGLSGLAVQKAEAYRDMLKDAIAELQEWREGDDVENEGGADSLLDSDDEGVAGDGESLEDMFNAANSLPADRDDLRELVAQAEDKLKKIVILYTAMIKRRLKTLPRDRGGLSTADSRKNLDRVMSLLKSLPPKVDDFASVLYELDAEGATTCLGDVVDTATKCVEISRLDTQGNEDEFTAWCVKWKEAVHEPQ